MGYFQQKNNGNSMGDATNTDAQKGKKKNPVEGGKSFKTGKVLNGLNNQDSDFPKAGRGPDWKMLRDSNISKGSI